MKTHPRFSFKVRRYLAIPLFLLLACAPALYLPGRFPEEKWKSEMDSMRTKVTITDREENLILQYLFAGK